MMVLISIKFFEQATRVGEGRGRERESERENNALISCIYHPSRLIDVELILVNEGDESNDFWNLTGDKKLYHSLASG